MLKYNLLTPAHAVIPSKSICNLIQPSLLQILIYILCSVSQGSDTDDGEYKGRYQIHNRLYY